jgi:hypothetical protein
MVDMVLGSKLPLRLQEQVLNAFLYRMTNESVKRWPATSQRMLEGGFRLTLISDAQWLASTYFAVTKRGTLARNYNHCEHDAYKFRTVREA